MIMSKMPIVLAAVMFSATANAQQGSVVQGDTDTIRLGVTGATLTFTTNEPTNPDPADVEGWKMNHTASGNLTDALDVGITEQLDGYASWDYLRSKVSECALKTELDPNILQSNMMLTSVVFPQCNQTLPKRACPSGDNGNTAVFYGRGLVVNVPGLYMCKLTVNGEDSYSNATVTYMQQDYSRQKITCELPPARDDDKATFDGSLVLLEGGTLTVPYVKWNPTLQFYNEGPKIQGLKQTFIPVKGETSRLFNDGRTVPIELVYGDAFDDDETLTVTFTPSDSTQIKQFTLNKKTKVVAVEFQSLFINTFVGLFDDQSKQLVSFTMKVTDSHQESTEKTLSFNLTHVPPAWSAEGSSKLLSEQVRSAILARAGKGQGEQFKLCYDANRDGWSTYTMHQNCDNQGALLMLMRRKGSDRVFGGYQFGGSQGGCSYRAVGQVGDVQDGQSASDRGWLFQVMDTSPKEVNFAYQKQTRYTFYVCNRYMLTWGGGHDFYCSNTYCYCNIGHTYRTTKSDNPDNTWCTGIYSFRPNTGMTPQTSVFDYYEVYALG